MKKIVSTLFVLSIFAFVTACHPGNSSSQVSNKPLHLSCDKSVDSLIRSSKYQNPMKEKDISFSIDNMSDSNLTIHVTHMNEEKRDVTVGWLQIDLVHHKLLDISVDPDSPVAIAGLDVSLIREIKSSCLSH